MCKIIFLNKERLMKKIFFILMSFLMLNTLATADDFGDGIKAYYAEHHEKAVDLLTRSCEGGNAEGCFFLGEMYRLGEGIEHGDTRAVALYVESCEGGYAMGCNSLGEVYEHGALGVEQDLVRAREYYDRACNLKKPTGCESRARLTEGESKKAE
jgi:TPR repeat protein